MSFNAADIRTDEETRQLTGVSRQIFPMQRVDTDKNAHLRGDDDYVRVAARHECRSVGYGNFETTVTSRRSFRR